MPAFRPNWKRAIARPRKPSSDPDLDAFYSGHLWRKTSILKRTITPLCEVCTSKGLVTAAQEVHHKKKVRDHPELAYEMSNLVSVCKRCHNALTAQGH